MSRLSFVTTPDPTGAETLVLIGRAGRLLGDDVRRLVAGVVAPRAWEDMIKRGESGDTGRIATTYTGGTPHKIAAIVLPEPCGRHNAPSRSWAIHPLLTGAGLKGPLTVVAALDESAHAFAVGMAVARSFPTWSASPRPEREIRIGFLAPDRAVTGLERLSLAANGTRRAADWTDQPPDRLNCDALVAEAEAIARAIPGVSIQVWRGAELQAHGLHGLFAVGKAAVEAPALVVLEWAPRSATRHLGWVGKGIVYDTGGLALKPKASMAGMKSDMAGSAAVLAAFEAAARMGATDRITAVLAIAENAIGPGALRPDDIVAMYSGRTVEINNPDAEGRLVLGDAAAWLARNRAPDEIWTLATLTGAQSVSTGKRHAAIYATEDEIEHRAVVSGRASGDTTHPLPYCPELWRREFTSPVADMKNSVKDRENAQSACAAQFIGNHLAAVGWTKPWCHVDMASPAVSGGRGTGYGVGLLLTVSGLGAPTSG